MKTPNKNTCPSCRLLLEYTPQGMIHKTSGKKECHQNEERKRPPTYDEILAKHRGHSKDIAEGVAALKRLKAAGLVKGGVE